MGLASTNPIYYVLITGKQIMYYSKSEGKNNGFIQRSYTANEASYIQAAKKQVKLLLINSKLQNYKWEGRLSLREGMTVQEHKNTWSLFIKNIKIHKIECFYVREVDANNTTLHYHLIVVDNGYTQKQMKKAIKSSLPKKLADCCEVRLKPIKSIDNYCHYILKARAGHSEKRRLWDIQGLNKLGATSGFWTTPQKQLWKAHIDSLEPFFQKNEQEHQLRQQATKEDRAKARAIAKLVDMSVYDVLPNIVSHRQKREQNE